MKFNIGSLYYCIYDSSYKKELLIARPYKNWKQWFTMYSYMVYPNSKMIIISFLGFQFRKRLDIC